jgi:hypothetical protein
MKFIKEALYKYFGTAIDIVDNLDTTIDYNLTAEYEVVGEVAEYLGILPRPMGVSMTVNII